jgi:hypothetical protein
MYQIWCPYECTGNVLTVLVKNPLMTTREVVRGYSGTYTKKMNMSMVDYCLYIMLSLYCTALVRLSGHVVHAVSTTTYHHLCF